MVSDPTEQTIQQTKQSNSVVEELEKLSDQLVLERDNQEFTVEITGIASGERSVYSDVPNEKLYYLIVKSEFDQTFYLECDPGNPDDWIFTSVGSRPSSVDDLIGNELVCSVKNNTDIQVNNSVTVSHLREGEYKARKLSKNVAEHNRLIDEALFMAYHGETGLGTTADVDFSEDEILFSPHTDECDAKFSVSVTKHKTWKDSDSFCQLINHCGSIENIKDAEFYLYPKEHYEKPRRESIAKSDHWVLLTRPYNEIEQEKTTQSDSKPQSKLEKEFTSLDPRIQSALIFLFPIMLLNTPSYLLNFPLHFSVPIMMLSVSTGYLLTALFNQD